ncbi:ABC transporter permease [Adlercreutzia murintestinalis]|uniref:ABC transporter permease n=1 Tax=Adlercreutzia murintestinalis TaxID=2941325 RepID=UPI00203C39C6|nr:ABC transporter permease [Adlercreutzia murintestinalis]
MNAMGRFTIKSLRANRVRTIVTIAGVALAAALLTAVLTTFTSLTNYLYQAEAIISGNWMAEAQSDDAAALEAEARDALEAGEVTGWALMQDVGFGQLTAAEQDIYGSYLPIVSVAGDIQRLCAMEASEGRMPQNGDEIILASTWRERGDHALGDTITIPVGQRKAVLVDAEKAAAGDAGVATLDPDGAAIATLADGDLLDSSTGYLDAAQDGGIFNEELVDTAERTFTIVGFYDRAAYTASFGVGLAAITAEASQAQGAARAYISMGGIESTTDVEQRAEAIFPGASLQYHTAMLRYLGVRGEGAVWNTFFGVASVLAAVIVVACVSLIYNAFAISVAERTRQFGLLSSVGASKRQLRRAVLLEALLVAAIGIPLGLLIGIGGCAVTFAILGPAIVEVIGDAGIAFGVHAEGWMIALAAALTLITVLLSIFVPAWRAGHCSAIDALRGAGGNRASRRGAALSAKSTDPARLWKRRGVSGRIFGIGGALSRVNRKRGAAKGTTAAVSLGLAIVLLMTAGSLNTFLGTLVAAADSDIRYDIGVSAMLDGGDTNVTDQVRVYSAAYDALCDVPDSEPVGWLLSEIMPIVIPEQMAGTAIATSSDRALSSAVSSSGKLTSGDYGAVGYVEYVDDVTFNGLAALVGADPVSFYDPEHPRAIATGSVYGNNGITYELMEMLAKPGAIRVLTGGTYQTASGQSVPVVSYEMNYAATDAQSGAAFSFVPWVNEADLDATEGGRADDSSSSDASVARSEAAVPVPLEDVQVETMEIDVVSLADEMPTIVGQTGLLRIVMPLSALSAQAASAEASGASTFESFDPSFTAGFNVTGNDSGTVAEALEQTARSQLASSGDTALDWFSFNNYLLQQNSNRTLATVVNVFCLLFTVILALIALANVFNTITNSLILRRREFAVMRSIGLSNRQFRAMIVDECASFGVKGLIPGMLVSVVVSYLLFCMVTQSISGLAFDLPWAYVGLAIAMTAAAMAISVAFGMHRCRADNVVEALRMDSI